MKRAIFGLLFAGMALLGCISSTVSSAKTDEIEYKSFGKYSSLPKNTETQRFYEYGEGFLIFNLYSITRFRLLNMDCPELYCGVGYKKYGEFSESDKELFIKKIKIDGVMVNYSMESLEPADQDGRITRALKVKVGDQEFLFDFVIETIPVAAGMPYDEIMRILGEPNDEKKGIIDTWTASGVSADLDDRYHEYWYLKYNKYSGYTLTLDSTGTLIELSR